MRAPAALAPHGPTAARGADAGARTSRLRALLAADPGLAATLALALLLSLGSAAYFLHVGLTTAYGDSRSRLLIARAVLEGRHAGLAQVGGVWLPFPQVTMLPFVWSDALYFSGIAGVIPSAVSYVVSSAFLYRVISRLTLDPVAGVVGVVAFSGPNLLYLQSVPMSELPFIACFLGVVHFTVRWMLKGSLLSLFLSAVMACLGTLTRYEGWVLVALLTVVVAWFCWRAGHRREEVEGLLLLFGLMAFLGVALWVLWNRVIFGDALYFLRSQYGTTAINRLQLATMTQSARPAGNLPLSVQVVGWTTLDNLGTLAVGLGLLGLARLALGVRFRPATISALVLLLFPVPFSILAAYLGAEVIGDPNATPGGQITNARYGLLAAPAVGFLVGWLAQGRWQRWPVLVACLLSAVLVWRVGLVDIEDSTSIMTPQGRPSSQAGQWLHGHYDGGLVLIQRRTNENLLFTSRIPLGDVVYEGDRDEWSAGLRDPVATFRWIVMDDGDTAQGMPPDAVWVSLHDGTLLLDRYHLVYRDGPILVYRR